MFTVPATHPQEWVIAQEIGVTEKHHQDCDVLVSVFVRICRENDSKRNKQLFRMFGPELIWQLIINLTEWSANFRHYGMWFPDSDSERKSSGLVLFYICGLGLCRVSRVYTILTGHANLTNECRGVLLLTGTVRVGIRLTRYVPWTQLVHLT